MIAADLSRVCVPCITSLLISLVRACASHHQQRFRFINRPDSVVMNSRQHRAAAASSPTAHTAAAAAGAGARAGSLQAGSAHSSPAPAAQSSAGHARSEAQAGSAAPAGSHTAVSSSKTDGAWAPGTVLRGLEGARGSSKTQPAAPTVGAAEVSSAAVSGALSISRGSDSRGGALGSSGAPEGRANVRTSSAQGENSGVQGAVHRLQARETALRGADGVRSEGPLFVDIVAVLVVFIVAGVYIRRVFFHGPKVLEAVPVYSALESG